MKLYMVHCGFYNAMSTQDLFECHTNFLIVASTAKEAKSKAQARPDFQERRMHIDGILEIEEVEGFKIKFEVNHEGQADKMNKYGFRELQAL